MDFLALLLSSRLESTEWYNSPEVLKNRVPITVIVRARNEEASVINTLESLKNQKRIWNGKEYSCAPEQVIIVNNASEDNTVEKVREFLDQYSNHFSGILLDEKEIGRGKSLQRGIEFARTNFIASVDADSIAHKYWLASHYLFLQRHPNVAAISGRTLFYNGPPHHHIIYDKIRTSVYTIGAAVHQGWISFANYSGRRDVFLMSGGTADIENVVPDDRVWSLKLRRWLQEEGWKWKLDSIGFNPWAIVYTDNWLSKKKYYLTELGDELTRVGKVSGVENLSTFNQVIIKTTPLFRRWDRFKNRL